MLLLCIREKWKRGIFFIWSISLDIAGNESRSELYNKQRPFDDLEADILMGVLLNRREHAKP